MPLVSRLVNLRVEETLAKHLGQNVAIGLSATGNQSQGNGYAITANWNEFTTVGATTNSATLPAAWGVSHGEIVIFNNGANTLYLYPASGENLNSLADNVGITVAAGKSARCLVAEEGRWLCLVA